MINENNWKEIHLNDVDFNKNGYLLLKVNEDYSILDNEGIELLQSYYDGKVDGDIKLLTWK